MIPQEHEIVVMKDAAAWRAWLNANEDTATSVWVLLAKKNTTGPTTLTYHEGLEEALCSGWIDGQRCGWDDTAFAQRYTPRSPRSLWSRRNMGIATRLIGEGRMRPPGQAEIDQARATGRWTAPRPDEADTRA
ncbi:YdeI/OmpD-associated family protein [Streptomyces arenae]|uniref:YdeI/OmpD-associated family protein n=1 Tax=Streptomyces arenae TaxID=29301 RepID=UPI002657AC0A|nr:hypothetical protein [Streptomyces arenae]MCG7204440.1 hypothetical protein [Streptomyces arenae]